MKTSTWVWIGVAGAAVYLYVTSAANKFTFLLQNVGIGFSGLTTQLNVTMLVTSAMTSTVTLTNFLVQVIYNNNVIGSSLSSATVNPGQNNIGFTVNLSDLTLVSDVTAAINNGLPSGTVQIQIKGAGQADGLPISFTQTYAF